MQHLQHPLVPIWGRQLMVMSLKYSSQVEKKLGDKARKAPLWGAACSHLLTTHFWKGWVLAANASIAQENRISNFSTLLLSLSWKL